MFNRKKTKTMFDAATEDFEANFEKARKIERLLMEAYELARDMNAEPIIDSIWSTLGQVKKL